MNQALDKELVEINSLVVALSEESLAVSPQDFIAVGSSDRKRPGLYSWWVDEDGAQKLTFGLGHLLPMGMIYAGLAGATRWPSGKQSSNTLWLRITKMHLGSNNKVSTFRHTLGAILANAERNEAIDEGALTNWMHSHLRVIVLPYHDADSLGRVEEAVLAELNPPLNLKGMIRTPLRRELTELRRKVVR